MTSRAHHPGHPRQGVEATLAAIATLAAAWPITTLLAETTWLSGTVLLMVVIALVGMGARWLGLAGWQVLTAQVVGCGLAAGPIFGLRHLWHGLPTVETLGFVGLLIRESLVTAQANAAPAPATPGLVFVVGCGIAVVALAVDYLAVTRRSPSLAGLPLLTAFLAAAANSGSSLPVRYFLAAAAMWMILLARSGGGVLRDWGTTVTVSRTPMPQLTSSLGRHQLESLARALGAVALAAAVAVPVILPQAEPKFLASGLGRNPGVDSERPGGVGFSMSLSLTADLNNRSKAPVLQFTTSDTSPPPLRVSVSSFYRAEQGVWLPWGRPLPPLSTDPELLAPHGLQPGVPRKVFQMAVQGNRLNDPYLAAPYPLIDANLDGIAWGADSETQGVRVAQRPDSYTASYWRLEPTAAMLRASPALGESDRDEFDVDLAVAAGSAPTVTSLSEQLTAGKASPYDKAMAIQEYLRDTGGFTYSLTLAPPARDESGKDAGFDPLTNFLVTKQGYCVQFASAMTMMSRAAGIPARIAIGFLPGTQAKGVWSVTASDAHAWPELYLNGIGWTRFEPTPSRGAPPGYALPVPSAGTPANRDPLDKETAPGPGTTTRPDPKDPSTGSSAAGDGSLTPASVLRWLTHGWGPVVLGSLIAALGSLIVPMAARWRRRRSVVEARTPEQRIEVEWEMLTSSLGDLGIAPAPSRTPRQQRAYYDREALLEAHASQALGRVVQTLEQSRYAVSPGAQTSISTDARRVYRAAAGTRAGTVRLRAALWPSDGITQLSSAKATLSRHVLAPLRALGMSVRRRFHRRTRP